MPQKPLAPATNRRNLPPMDDDREDEIRTASGLRPVLTAIGLLAVAAAIFASGDLAIALGIVGAASLGGSIVAGMACDETNSFERDCQTCERQPISPDITPTISQEYGMPERKPSWVASLDRPRQACRRR
jgi:hypothetical protein